MLLLLSKRFQNSDKNRFENRKDNDIRYQQFQVPVTPSTMCTGRPKLSYVVLAYQKLRVEAKNLGLSTPVTIALWMRVLINFDREEILLIKCSLFQHAMWRQPCIRKGVVQLYLILIKAVVLRNILRKGEVQIKRKISSKERCWTFCN